MLVVLIGDTHGQDYEQQKAMRLCDELDAAGVISLGDYGFWPNDQFFAPAARRWVKRSKGSRFFSVVDGNHDFPGFGNRADGGYLAWSAPSPEAGKFSHLSRGTAFDLDGVRFGVLGGAVSIDRKRRALGRSYWLEEVISPADCELAVAGGPVDVWLTHDAPVAPPGFERDPEWLTKDLHLISDLRVQRERIWQVWAALRPQFVFHGHWHIAYEHRLTLPSGEFSSVRGLADGSCGPASLWVLDTDRITPGSRV
jgi:predicted phosphodiesterase